MDKDLEPLIYDEANRLWYRLQGDYYIPCLELPPEDTDDFIGKYGRMRRSFLKEHRATFYRKLLSTGKLHSHLKEIDKACEERMDTICTAMAAREGVTEALKASSQMEWVRRMNSIRCRAEEIVLHELVYGY